jgi:hypothetical protein
LWHILEFECRKEWGGATGRKNVEFRFHYRHTEVNARQEHRKRTKLVHVVAYSRKNGNEQLKYPMEYVHN